ncbi:MAG: heparinase II/III family protein, partial [Chloroflexota bacterium]
SYQTYGLSLSLPFLVNLRRLTGQDLMPHTYLRNYAYWRLYNYLPHIVYPVFTHGNWELNYGNAHQPHQLLRLVASEYADARAQWLAQALVDADGRHANVWCSPWAVFGGLWYDPSIPAQAPDGLPLDRTFPDFEGVIWRSGWGDNDLVFALKTGPYGGRNPFTTWVNGQYPWDHPGLDCYNVGHDHDDTNTFYLYRGNVDLSSENLGYNQNQTSLHNTLLIDGSGQYRPPETYGSHSYWWGEPRLFEGIDGLLQATYQAGGFSFLVADATNRYRSTGSDGEPIDFWVNEYKRHVLFVKPSYVVMVDNIRSDTAHRYDWVAHLGSSVTMEESWVKGAAASNQVLGIKVLSPASFSTSIGNDGKDYVRVRPSSDVADVRFVNVLYPTDTTQWDLKPLITSLGETDQASGVRVSLDGTQDHLFKYGSEGSVSLGEYEFNGQVASVIKDSQGNLTRLFLGKGTHLADSNGSRTLLQASNPAIVLEVTYSGTALALWGENVEGLSLYAPNVDPGEVTLNGQPVDAARDGDSIVLGDFSPPRPFQPSATSVPPTSTPTSALAAAIPLQPGWNLVSVPVHPSDTSAAAVLSTIAGEYDRVLALDASDESEPWRQLDPSVPFFANDLLTIDETRGLWLHAADAVTWAFPGSTPPSATISLHPGWNLVGYPLPDAQPIADALASIEGNYTLVYTHCAFNQADTWEMFDPAVPPWSNELTQMVPGRGYWILVTQPCEWSLASQSGPALSQDSLRKREAAAFRPQEIPAEGSGSIPRPPSLPGSLRGPIQINAAGS